LLLLESSLTTSLDRKPHDIRSRSLAAEIDTPAGGYDRHKSLSDLIAGVTGGLVPLSLAFAITSGTMRTSLQAS